MAKRVVLRFLEDELAGIERVRGDQPRERWIRQLCAAAVSARDRAGEACDLSVVATRKEDGDV